MRLTLVQTRLAVTHRCASTVGSDGGELRTRESSSSMQGLHRARWWQNGAWWRHSGRVLVLFDPVAGAQACCLLWRRLAPCRSTLAPRTHPKLRHHQVIDTRRTDQLVPLGEPAAQEQFAEEHEQRGVLADRCFPAPGARLLGCASPVSVCRGREHTRAAGDRSRCRQMSGRLRRTRRLSRLRFAKSQTPEGSGS